MLTVAVALLQLGQRLQEAGYRFVTVTPETHRRHIKRRAQAESVRDIFGWSLPFAQSVLPPPLWRLAQAAEVLQSDGALWRSRVRFSSLGNDLFVHSAFPTQAADSVFFGPDTYRYANLLLQRARPATCCVDVGCGTGAGALVLRERVCELVLADINPGALQLAGINAQLAGAGAVSLCESDILRGVGQPFDLVVANPPYVVDSLGRVYRDGGGAHGVDIALRIVREALERLPAGGQLLLYTGTPVCDGVDKFYESLQPLLRSRELSHTYGEIDPDVFGEELDRPAYARAERLAVVFLDVTVR